MAFLCGEYKTIIYRGKGLSDCLLREVNKLSYTLNLNAYCASIEGAIVIIEESQLCFALKRFKFQIQKSHSLSGFFVYMVPAPRVELGTY